MTSMREQVTPHVTTVTAVSTGEVPTHRRRSERRVRTTRVVVRRDVHPEVWAQALTLAKGDAKRIGVVSYTEVLVR